MNLTHTPSVIAAAVLSTLASAGAASLSITSGPSFDTGAVTSTISGQLINGNLIKVSGDASFVQPGTPLSSITMTLTGTFSATRGDVFTLDYEFSGTLTGPLGLEVDYDLEMDLLVGGVFAVNGVVEESGTFTTGTSFKSDSDSAEIPDAVSFMIWVSVLTIALSDSSSWPTSSFDPLRGIETARLPVVTPRSYRMIDVVADESASASLFSVPAQADGSAAAS